MKEEKVKLRVYSTSGPAWQPVKDGQPYNRWVGTIQYSNVERVIFGQRYTVTVVGDTKEEVEKQLDKYIIGEVVDVPVNSINPQPIIGGRNASTTR
jgi:hypothetical protein